MTQVRELMTPDPEHLSADDTLVTAAQRMRDADVGSLPICDAEGQVTGIVTDRDIVVRALAEGKGPDARVDDVATTAVQSLTPDQTVDDAIEIVRSQNVRRVPVVQDGRPVGIVSIGDLAVERDQQSALAEISAASPNN